MKKRLIIVIAGLALALMLLPIVPAHAADDSLAIHGNNMTGSGMSGVNGTTGTTGTIGTNGLNGGMTGTGVTRTPGTYSTSGYGTGGTYGVNGYGTNNGVNNGVMDGTYRTRATGNRYRAAATNNNMSWGWLGLLGLIGLFGLRSGNRERS